MNEFMYFHIYKQSSEPYEAVKPAQFLIQTLDLMNWRPPLLQIIIFNSSTTQYLVIQQFYGIELSSLISKKFLNKGNSTKQGILNSYYQFMSCFPKYLQKQHKYLVVSTHKFVITTVKRIKRIRSPKN